MLLWNYGIILPLDLRYEVKSTVPRIVVLATSLRQFTFTCVTLARLPHDYCPEPSLFLFSAASAMTSNPESSTMDTQLRDQTERLPIELKCVVARFITTRTDRKSVATINKAWSAVVLPFLWDTFKTDLLQRGGRSLSALANANSNIIKHVRHIHLLARTLVGNADHLPTLLAAIPRGQLRGFATIDEIQASSLNLLLLLHPKLDSLILPAGSSISEALQSPWTSGCFSNVHSMVLDVESVSCEGFRRLWRECRGLRKLDLRYLAPVYGSGRSLPQLKEELFAKSTNPPVGPRDSDTTVTEAHTPLALTRLFIGNVLLPKSIDKMFERIEALALQVLQLDMTFGISNLFKSLASSFAQKEVSLKHLRINRLPKAEAEEVLESLLLFLTSFCGLETIWIQCDDCSKISTDGIINHGETLKTLFIVNGGVHRQDKTKCMVAEDLQQITTACPELQQLCLNLYEIDPDRNEGDILGPQPGVSFVANEFEEALQAVASMPKLKVLRLTNPPNYRQAYRRPGELLRWFPRSLQSGTERLAFKARADGVMQYLSEHGSNVQLLAFSPMEKLNKATSADKHGHVWPDYYYYGGRLTDVKGTDIAVARPLVDWKTEDPSVTVW
ncbi:hypothetical protein BKA63DRAFT_515100 [Paraphoma chrysanthemicola]|nr:hypothetical protein BKA63DRAFT_515100 [Paraphoma chrysanthemicola]